MKVCDRRTDLPRPALYVTDAHGSRASLAVPQRTAQVVAFDQLEGDEAHLPLGCREEAVPQIANQPAATVSQ